MLSISADGICTCLQRASSTALYTFLIQCFDYSILPGHFLIFFYLPFIYHFAQLITFVELIATGIIIFLNLMASGLIIILV